MSESLKPEDYNGNLMGKTLKFVGKEYVTLGYAGHNNDMRFYYCTDKEENGRWPASVVVIPVPKDIDPNEKCVSDYCSKT